VVMSGHLAKAALGGNGGRRFRGRGPAHASQREVCP